MRATVSRASAGRSAGATQGSPLAGSVAPEDVAGVEVDVGAGAPGSSPPACVHQTARAATSATTAPRTERVRLTGPASERHRLGATLDLGPAVLAQGVDRPTGQVRVDEQPGDALAVVVVPVVQQRQQPRKALAVQP